jgi:2-polyprenyl-3-methyl-5-hydroxy-6-metoxy-1,4-benzoquinol methylase
MIKTFLMRNLSRPVPKIVQGYRWRQSTNEEIFDQIYEKNLWGPTTERNVFSGRGSSQLYSKQYEEIVAQYIQKDDIKTVLDFGCGDFQVSERIFRKCGEIIEITGLDVSLTIIEKNREYYSDRQFTFIHDNGESELARYDLITIRQMLQHNSNGEIQKVLDRVFTIDWESLSLAEGVLRVSSSNMAR